MLKIRLQRTGRTNEPSYRIIVTEHTNGPKAGKAVDTVGFYNPTSKERKVNAERVLYWISKGAQPSDTVHNMLIAVGILKGKKRNVIPQSILAPKPVETKAEEPTSSEVAAPAQA